MCGRYTLHLTQQKLADAIAAEIPADYAPDYNIGPGSELLSITQIGEPVRTLHWGLRTPQNFHINARLETADATPRFREAWETHRCLIPANGFYEWLNDGVRKQPYYIYPSDGELLYFAGLWFPSEIKDHPAQCVLLTTSAQAAVQEIHERMPVILPKSVHYDWLHNNLAKSETASFAEKVSLAKHTISTRVNSVQNKDSKLIVATTPQTDDQMQLF